MVRSPQEKKTKADHWEDWWEDYSFDWGQSSAYYDEVFDQDLTELGLTREPIGFHHPKETA